MCSRRMARNSARLQVPEVSQAGSWLCQAKVCPRTFCPCCRAKVTSSSAWVKSYRPRSGWTTSHFITFSGVTLENSLPTSSRYLASLRSAVVSTAVPISSFVCRASCRRVAVVGSGTARASVPATSGAAAAEDAWAAHEVAAAPAASPKTDLRGSCMTGLLHPDRVQQGLGRLGLACPGRRRGTASPRGRRERSAGAEQVLDREALHPGEAVALGAGAIDVVVLERRPVGEQLGVGLAVAEGGLGQLGDLGRLEVLLHLGIGAERPRLLPQAQVELHVGPRRLPHAVDVLGAQPLVVEVPRTVVDRAAPGSSVLQQVDGGEGLEQVAVAEDQVLVVAGTLLPVEVDVEQLARPERLGDPVGVVQGGHLL